MRRDHCVPPRSANRRMSSTSSHVWAKAARSHGRRRPRHEIGVHWMPPREFRCAVRKTTAVLPRRATIGGVGRSDVPRYSGTTSCSSGGCRLSPDLTDARDNRQESTRPLRSNPAGLDKRHRFTEASRRGSLSYFPPTPPDMRVRIRRFSELRLERDPGAEPRETRSTHRGRRYASPQSVKRATSVDSSEP